MPDKDQTVQQLLNLIKKSRRGITQYDPGRNGFYTGISKEFMETRGYRMQLISEYRKGSEFSFFLAKAK